MCMTLYVTEKFNKVINLIAILSSNPCLPALQ